MLIESHQCLAGLTKQLYAQPLETLNAWSDLAIDVSAGLYERIENDILPKAEAVYQHWLDRVTLGANTASQYWRDLLDDPEQSTMEIIEPVSLYLVSAIEQSERYW